MDPAGTRGQRPIGALPLAVVLFVLGCAPPAVPQSPFVEIATATATRYVRVEIAETEPERQRGLMGRTRLEDDAGMIFIWPEDTRSTFWMKDTPLRLTVAFISASGEILKTLDMEPCAGDPCPVHDPGLSYRMALEVRQGTLERIGARVGDTVRLVR